MEQYLEYIQRAGQAASGWLDAPSDSGEWTDTPSGESAGSLDAQPLAPERVPPDATATRWDAMAPVAAGVPAWVIVAGAVAALGLGVYALAR